MSVPSFNVPIVKVTPIHIGNPAIGWNYIPNLNTGENMELAYIYIGLYHTGSFTGTFK